MSGGLVVGWTRRRWRAKTACVTCLRRIRSGITHVRDRQDPPTRAMCQACYTAIMDTPETFAETHIPPPDTEAAASN